MILLLPLLLAATQSITPAECKANPEWCFCRRYVEVENNKCVTRASRKAKTRLDELRAQVKCRTRYTECKKACASDDTTLCPEELPSWVVTK